jgi:hypothetical protein
VDLAEIGSVPRVACDSIPASPRLRIRWIGATSDGEDSVAVAICGCCDSRELENEELGCHARSK